MLEASRHPDVRNNRNPKVTFLKKGSTRFGENGGSLLAPLDVIHALRRKRVRMRVWHYLTLRRRSAYLTSRGRSSCKTVTQPCGRGYVYLCVARKTTGVVKVTINCEMLYMYICDGQFARSVHLRRTCTWTYIQRPTDDWLSPNLSRETKIPRTRRLSCISTRVMSRSKEFHTLEEVKSYRRGQHKTTSVKAPLCLF